MPRYVLMYAYPHASMRVPELQAVCEMLHLDVTFNPQQVENVCRGSDRCIEVELQWSFSLRVGLPMQNVCDLFGFSYLMLENTLHENRCVQFAWCWARVTLQLHAQKQLKKIRVATDFESFL